MASTVGDEKAGNQDYQTNHMALLFEEGLSFSGFERDALFLNREGTRFQEISGVSGIDSISDGRSAVPVDLDNDGDLDIFLTTIQGEGHLLFRNNVGQDKGFIRVELEGTKSGRDAFGAQVRVKTPLGVQTRILSGGSGFMAQPDRRLLFGLGDAAGVEWMEVTWPSGVRQRFGPISAGVSLKVVEEEADYQALSLPPAALPDPLEEGAGSLEQAVDHAGPAHAGIGAEDTSGGGGGFATAGEGNVLPGESVGHLVRAVPEGDA